MNLIHKIHEVSRNLKPQYLRSELTEVATGVSKLTEDNAILRSQLQTAMEERDRLNNELHGLQMRSNDFEQLSMELRTERDALRSELQSAMEERDAANVAMNETYQQWRSMRSNLDHLLQEIQQAHMALDESTPRGDRESTLPIASRISRLIALLSDKTAAVDYHFDEAREAKAECAKLSALVDENEVINTNYAHKLVSLEARLTEANSRLEEAFHVLTAIQQCESGATLPEANSKLMTIRENAVRFLSRLSTSRSTENKT